MFETIDLPVEKRAVVVAQTSCTAAQSSCTAPQSSCTAPLSLCTAPLSSCTAPQPGVVLSNARAADIAMGAGSALLLEKRTVSTQPSYTVPQPSSVLLNERAADVARENGSALPVEKRAVRATQKHRTAPQSGSALPSEKRAVRSNQAPCTAPQHCHSQQADVRAAASHPLDPSAKQFIWRDPNLVHKGLLRPDLDLDWASVQAVQAGGAGPQGKADFNSWGHVSQVTSMTSHHLDLEPFSLTPDDLEGGLPAPARPVLKASSLKDRIILTPSGPFTDKILPAPTQTLPTREIFTPEYFSSLHNLVQLLGLGRMVPHIQP